MTATRALRLATGPSGDPDLDRRWIARRLALDGAAVEAATALDAAGIPVILLKGPVTAARLYSGEFRPYVDIDLLVAPTAYAKAGAVLSGLGYQPLGASPVAGTYVRRSDGCRVDLHRSLSCVRADPAAVWRVLSRHQVPFPLRQATLSTLDVPAFGLHLALHATQTGARKPKPAVDLERAVRALPASAWSEAAAIAADLGAVDAMNAALRCGSPAAVRLADRVGLPARFPFRYQAMIRRPACAALSVADLSSGAAADALRQWMLPSAAERAERMANADARRVLPGAPPAVRYAALRAGQAGALAAGVLVEAVRRLAGDKVRRCAAFARLPWREKLLLARYLMTSACLEVALWFFSPSAVVATVAATARPGRRAVVPWRRRKRLAARAASAFRPGRSCLPEALLLWRDALVVGEPATLIIGVRTVGSCRPEGIGRQGTAPGFLAHAWVESADGTVLGSGTRPPAMSRLAVWGPDGRLVPGRCIR